MNPAQMFQGQQLQQLQLQLRQLEMQIQLQQQQLQESWQPEQQKQQAAQPESQQQEPAKLESQPQQQETAQPDPQQKKTQQEQKQMPTYFTAPEMVSTLDIGYLQDMLSSNLLAVKQYRQASKDCQLPDLKLQFKEVGQIHLQHYNNLLSFLSENGGTVK